MPSVPVPPDPRVPPDPKVPQAELARSHRPRAACPACGGTWGRGRQGGLCAGTGAQLYDRGHAVGHQCVHACVGKDSKGSREGNPQGHRRARCDVQRGSLQGTRSIISVYTAGGQGDAIRGAVCAPSTAGLGGRRRAMRGACTSAGGHTAGTGHGQRRLHGAWGGSLQDTAVGIGVCTRGSLRGRARAVHGPPRNHRRRGCGADGDGGSAAVRQCAGTGCFPPARTEQGARRVCNEQE